MRINTHIHSYSELDCLARIKLEYLSLCEQGLSFSLQTFHMKVDKKKASSFLSSLEILSLSFKTPACAGHQWHQAFMKAPAHSAVPRTNEKQTIILHGMYWTAWICDMIHWHDSAMTP